PSLSPLSLHDALPIFTTRLKLRACRRSRSPSRNSSTFRGTSFQLQPERERRRSERIRAAAALELPRAAELVALWVREHIVLDEHPHAFFCGVGCVGSPPV